MSAGSKIIQVRFPPGLEKAMNDQITLSESYRHQQPWTVGEFIRTAVQEKLEKMARGRRRKKVKRVIYEG